MSSQLLTQFHIRGLQKAIQNIEPENKSKVLPPETMWPSINSENLK